MKNIVIFKTLLTYYFLKFKKAMRVTCHPLVSSIKLYKNIKKFNVDFNYAT